MALREEIDRVENIAVVPDPSKIPNTRNVGPAAPRGNPNRIRLDGEVDIRILQLNMRRSVAVTGEVRALVAEKRLDVLLLQEPHVRGQRTGHVFYGLGTSMKVAAVRTERPWAAVALCNPDYNLLFVSQLSTTHCVCAEVQAPSFSFYVVSHYFQWSDDIGEHLRHLAMVLRSLRGKRVLIALDANARSALWGPQESNERGTQVERLIQEFDLRVANRIDQGPTFWTTQGSSYIDVTLGSPSMTPFIGEWKIRDNWTTSDHNAVDIRLRAPTAVANAEGAVARRFNVKRADWDLFASALIRLSETRLQGLPLSSVEEVETMAKTLTEVLTGACTESMPRKVCYRKSNPWWTRRLTNLKKGVYRLRRAYIGARDELRRREILRDYRTSLRSYSGEVKSAKNASWRRFVTSHGNKEPWGFVYKHQANKLRVEKVLSTIRHNGTVTMDMRESASCLLDTHVPDDHEQNDTPQQRVVRDGARVAPDTPNAAPFTEAEVRNIVRNLKNNKAPGPDLIEVVVLKAAFSTIPAQMVRLFNACLQWGTFPSAWKEGSLRILLKGEDKDEQDPKSYRPICLLSVIGKLFESLLKERLARTAMAPGRLSDRQFGFTPGRSAEDAIVELRRMVAASQETYTVAMLFDISGAFDNVWWPLVLQNLRERECPANVFETICSYFENRKVKITWGREEVSKQATRGCPQGSVLGPACWNLMFDGLLRILEVETPDSFVAYADDLLVLVKGGSRREIEERGQRVVNVIVQWCDSANLQLSERKTEAIVLKSVWNRPAPIGRRGGERPDRQRRQIRRPNLAYRYPAIRIGNTAIRFKESVRYLGVHFDREMGIGTHCQYLRAKTAKLFDRLRKLAGVGWGLRFKTLATVYRGVFVPTVTYGAAGWTDLCGAKDIRVLRSAQRRALIATVAAYNTVSIPALCVIGGAIPVDLLLKESVARYEVRNGRNAEINGIVVPAAAEDAVARIRSEVMNAWQAAWEVSEKGRTTFAFFDDVRDRMAASWFRPDHYVTQVISGHGNFGAKLAQFACGDGEQCSCGLRDTAEHLLLECANFEPQRVALRDHIGDLEWPEAVHRLVETEEALSVFADFSREALWLKGMEDGAIAGEEVEIEREGGDDE